MDNSFLHTKRLLLVDDEQELLKMVSDILKDATFPHFYQCADHFLNSKGRSSRQIIGIGAWCR